MWDLDTLLIRGTHGKTSRGKKFSRGKMVALPVNICIVVDMQLTILLNIMSDW